MSRKLFFALLLAAGVLLAGAQAKTGEAQEQTQNAPARTEVDSKQIPDSGGKALGMSILGNQDAPKALVIVPWKSSELGGLFGISPMLDDSRAPIDKEVFMRMLIYSEYSEIRSETVRPDGASTKTNAEQSTTAPQRRNP